MGEFRHVIYPPAFALRLSQHKDQGVSKDTNEKSENLQAWVDGRLDDLFSTDDENSVSEPERLQDVVDNRLDDLFSMDDEAPGEQSESHTDEVDNRSEGMEPSGDKKVRATEKKSAGKDAIGVSRNKKLDEPKIIVAPGVDETASQKHGKSVKKAKPVALKKEQPESAPKQTKNSKGLIKVILVGLIITGGGLAFFFLSKSPETPGQNRPVATVTTQKIKNLPAKTPAPETTPPPAPPVSKRDTGTPRPSEIISTEKKTPAPTTMSATAYSEIEKWLLEWATAWEKCAGENGDMEAYASCYSDDFSSSGFDKNEWQKDKLEKNRKKEWIRVKLDNINIVGPLGDGIYEAKFTQIYQSSNYSDTSRQIFVLKKEVSGWKIIGFKPQAQTRYPLSIHGGSYRTLKNAQKRVAGFIDKGLEAYWARADIPGKGTWYRVFIGYYLSLESALKVIADKALSDVRPFETRYANLIGIFYSEVDLNRQRRYIVGKGCSPYVISDDSGALNLYTGAYASLENAEKYSAELESLGIPSQVVER